MSDAQKPHSEQIARRFHEAYERLAPEYGYATRPESAVPWESVPLMNKRLMVATVEEACSDLFEQVEAERSKVEVLQHIVDGYPNLKEQLEALREERDGWQAEANEYEKRLKRYDAPAPWEAQLALSETMCEKAEAERDALKEQLETALAFIKHQDMSYRFEEWQRENWRTRSNSFPASAPALDSAPDTSGDVPEGNDRVAGAEEPSPAKRLT